MFKIIKTFALSVVALAWTVQAQAQTPEPQPEGSNLYWGDSAQTGKRYPTAAAACQGQYDYRGIAASGHPLYGTYPTSNPRRVECDWRNFHHDGVGPVVVLPQAVYARCTEGTPVKNGDTVECTTAVDYLVCNDCDIIDGVGNPIIVGAGSKYHSRVDYQSSDGLFRIKRNYTSRPISKMRTGGRDSAFGTGWHLDDDMGFYVDDWYKTTQWEIDLDVGGTQHISFKNSSGPILTPIRNLILGNSDAIERGWTITQQTSDRINVPTEWIVSAQDGRKMTFRTFKVGEESYRYGRPIRIEWPGGYVQTREYDDYGVLLKMDDNLGRTAEFVWGTWRPGHAVDGEFTPYLDDDGQPLPLRKTRVQWIRLPDGSLLNYQYDDQPNPYTTGLSHAGKLDRLTQMRRLPSAYEIGPVTTAQIIDHETYEYGSSDRYDMTGLVDANHVKVGTYTYNEDGQAVSSEGPGGVGRVEVEYGDETVRGYGVTHHTTDVFGRKTSYEYGFSHPRWVYRNYSELKSITEAATADLPETTRSFDYKKYWGMARKVDREGRVTTFELDENGQVTREVMAAGTPEEVVTETDWHPTILGLKAEVRAPGLTTRYTHDAEGRVTSVTLADTQSVLPASRTWEMTYGTSNPMRPTSIDGPLPGPDDTVRFEWSGERLQSTTNEVGHVTRYSDFTAHGLPQLVTDPNGVRTTIAYDAMHRPVEIIEDEGRLNATTTLAYDGLGQILSVSLPNGTSLSMEYDDARRLRAVENAAGERMEMDYNLASALTATRIVSSNGTVEQMIEQIRDVRNRVTSTVSPSAGGLIETLFAYDRESNPLSTTDADGNLWTRGFDALDRVVEETDPEDGVTLTEYAAQADARDALTGVTDPRGAVTQYLRNGFGEVVSEISMEEGTTTYTRDERGLVSTATDARGKIARYSYDAAGRLVSVNYDGHNGDRAVYTYDQGKNGVGRLTRVQEATHNTRMFYNALGHMVRKRRRMAGVDYETRYSYDLSGEVRSTLYPSGNRVLLNRDAAARVIRVRVRDADGELTTVLSGARYRAFGPLSGANFGDGHKLSIAYDQSGRALSLTRRRGGDFLMDTAFTTDGRGNHTALVDRVDATRTQNFAYDGLSRLTRAEGAYGAVDYTWNAGGDRTSRAWSYLGTDGQSWSRAERLDYNTDNFRLETVSLDTPESADPVLRDFRYDAAGNPIRDFRANASGSGDRKTGAANFAYGYNARGRLVRVNRNGERVADYRYDDTQQRILKTVTADDGTSTTTRYHYDERDRLLAETGAGGETLREYVWLGLTPVAMVVHGSEEADDGTSTPTQDLVWLHADHLGRPVAATDADGGTLWRSALLTPFGDDARPWLAANDNGSASVATALAALDGLGSLTQHLRFPGQYADAETRGADGTELSALTTLSHNHNRTYDPMLGRYLTPDPIGLAGGLNRYAYVGGNPVKDIDPTGEVIPIVVGIGVGLAADYVLDRLEAQACDNKCKPYKVDPLAPALGGLAGTFGPFSKKHRTGVAGGGRSGKRTSPYSRGVHALRNRGGISQASSRRLRRLGRFAGKGLGALNIGYYGYRIHRIAKCY